MSGFAVITPHTFNDGSSAVSANSDWYTVDSRFDGGGTLRTIMGSKAATGGDAVSLELRVVKDNVTVITTATTWDNTFTSFSTVIQGPFSSARIRKIGSSAAATVVGML